MKKFTALFLCIIMSVTLFGCSADDTNTADSVSSSSSVITAETVTSADEKSDSTQADAVPSESKSSSKQTASESSRGSSQSGVSGKSSTTAEPTSSAAAAGSGTGSSKKETAKTTAKSTTAKQQTTTTSSTITCTVTVECKSILSHMDELKAGHEAYVPSNGYIINGCTVTVDNGSSAYDAVKAACDRQGVYINAVNSSYGIYVAGFNNIDEKDCGSQSGWLYSVNGVYPGKSCGKYKLSNGDNVVFTYTCSYK